MFQTHSELWIYASIWMSSNSFIIVEVHVQHSTLPKNLVSFNSFFILEKSSQLMYFEITKHTQGEFFLRNETRIFRGKK